MKSARAAFIRASVEKPQGFFNAKEEAFVSLKFSGISGRLTDER